MTTTSIETPNASAVDVRRLVNDSIRGVGSGFRPDEAGAALDFLCECGDLRCRRSIRLTLAEYDATQPGFVSAHV
jgi:hypothetical protein